MTPSFEIQGHRGARARRPENTLPSFEAALDACATSIETDLQVSHDGELFIYHDSRLSSAICSNFSTDGESPRLADLSSSRLLQIKADRNPDSRRFPHQTAERTPMSEAFARGHFPDPYDPYAIPMLHHLFALVAAYAGDEGKSLEQRRKAKQIILDLEIKNEPFEAPIPATTLQKVADVIAESGMMQRCRVRSFDHRIVKRMGELRPQIELGILITGTVPIDPVKMVRDAGAALYCPDYRMLDELQVKQLQREGIRVLPWTVNEPSEWRRLLDWGVDGITTDDPAELFKFRLGSGFA